MSLMAYLVLFLVAGYLFRVNPVLCVGLVGAVVFFKVRGFFGGRKGHARSPENAASNAALVALCLSILERSDQRRPPMDPPREGSLATNEDDPLEGLFRH